MGGTETAAESGWARRVACPSPTECEAVGTGTRHFAGVALLTTDGGATWTVQKLPSGTGGLATVACPSTSVCQAGGLDASASAGKVVGTTARRPALGHRAARPHEPIVAISCVVSICEAVGRSADRYSGDALRSTDGGRTWTIQHMPGGIGALNSVDCTSALICQAVGGNPSGSAGDAVHTTNGGSTWETEGLPGIDALSALACTSATDCETAGVGRHPGPHRIAFVSKNGGRSWRSNGVSPGVGYFGGTGLACPAATSWCEAAGGNPFGSGGYVPREGAWRCARWTWAPTG